MDSRQNTSRRKDAEGSLHREGGESKKTEPCRGKGLVGKSQDTESGEAEGIRHFFLNVLQMSKVSSSSSHRPRIITQPSERQDHSLRSLERHGAPHPRPSSHTRPTRPDHPNPKHPAQGPDRNPIIEGKPDQLQLPHYCWSKLQARAESHEIATIRPALEAAGRKIGVAGRR